VKFRILTLSGIAVFAFSCAEKTQEPASKAPDACQCAQNAVAAAPDSVLRVSCDSAFQKNTDFALKYNKCLGAQMAGIDTSQVTLTRMADAKGVAALDDGLYQAVSERSGISWNASKVTGKHNGTVVLKSLSLEVKNGTIASGKVIMDMSAITVLDLQGEEKGKLEGHLRSTDFFSADAFPEASFQITSVNFTAAQVAEVTGNLSIKGITASQKGTFTVLQSGDSSIQIAGAMAIDRTAFDIRYGSGKFFSDLGDKAIDDIFFVTIQATVSK
jgi:polyisoprenoid-binding protein YceI